MNRAREGEFKRESEAEIASFSFAALYLSLNIIFPRGLPRQLRRSPPSRRRKCPMMCPKVVFQAIEGSHAGVIDGLSEDMNNNQTCIRVLFGPGSYVH